MCSVIPLISIIFSDLQVHLLTAVVDDLTAEASAPVDRLAGAALAVSKAELGERIQQQSNFEMQADELKARVARVRTHASKAVENSRHTSKVRHVRVTGDFIDRLTPQVIAAARALAGEITLLPGLKLRFCYLYRSSSVHLPEKYPKKLKDQNL